MSKLHREIISRLALLVLGGGLLFGGWKCFGAASDIRNDPVANEMRMKSPRRDTSGAQGLPLLAGSILFLFGAPLTLAALVPTALFAKIMGTPSMPPLHNNPEPSNSIRHWL